jgi:hypothetical protein
LRAARALFPALYGFGAYPEEVREYGLAGVQAFADAANFGGLERGRRGRNLGYSQIHILTALKGQSVGQRLPQVVVDIHLDLVALLQFLQFGYQRAKIFSLLGGQVFLLVLIQQEEQVNVVVQMHIPIAAALAFSAGRVCSASLAYSAQPFRDIALFGIFEQVLLYLSQDLVGRRTRQAMEPAGECLRFYEYYTVVYTTL